MQRKRDSLVPIGEVIADLPGPVQALIPSPPTQRHFTLADQVDQLVSASDSGPRPGLHGAAAGAVQPAPHQPPGNRKEYIRHNGPYTLGMTAGINNKLSYGNLPPAAAGVGVHRNGADAKARACSRALDRQRQRREPGGGGLTRLRNQMKRLSSVAVSHLIYEDERGNASVSSFIADRTEFWWNDRKPDERTLWENKKSVSVRTSLTRSSATRCRLT